eukprot:3051263-Prymnesium_polylepis.2
MLEHGLLLAAMTAGVELRGETSFTSYAFAPRDGGGRWRARGCRLRPPPAPPASQGLKRRHGQNESAGCKRPNAHPCHFLSSSPCPRPLARRPPLAV